MRPFEVKMVASGLALLGILSGCKGEPPAQTSAKPVSKSAASVATKVAKATAEEAVPAAEPPKYVYETAGRRDPFEPLVSDRMTVPEGGEEISLTPLQKYAVDQFRLTGIIVGKGQPAAMVAAPDGKGYVVRKGVKIGKNNGVVTDISPNGIVIEEQYQDFSGNILKNELEIKPSKREGVK